MVQALYCRSIAYGGMTFMGIITSFIRFVSFGKGINLNRTLVAPFFCNVMLKLVGVKVENKIKQHWNDKNVVYFFNHNSFLDIFIIPLLGLKDTRFIISEGIKNVLPLHLCNLGVEVLYIPDSEKTKERVAFFKQVSQDLRQEKYSVICAPEGRHDWLHGIASFNRGVFHMAAAAHTPIHNLFFEIPRDANPMLGPDMKPCSVKINSMELIETKAWDLENIDDIKDSMRLKFLEYYKEHYGDYGDSIK